MDPMQLIWGFKDEIIGSAQKSGHDCVWPQKQHHFMDFYSGLNSTWSHTLAITLKLSLHLILGLDIIGHELQEEHIWRLPAL